MSSSVYSRKQYILGIEGISKETLALTSQIYEQLDEELTFYYKYNKKLENVASRIYKLHNILTAVEVSPIRNHSPKFHPIFFQKKKFFYSVPQ